MAELLISCPVCNARTAERECPGCGEDLSVLQECQALAVRSFNTGIRLAQSRRRRSLERAVECLNLAAEIKADFPAPHIVLGKLYARQKRYPEAIAAFSRALSYDKKCAPAREALDAIRRLFGGDEKLRLEAGWQGKPVYLGSRLLFADGSKSRVWRILPGKAGREFTHLVSSAAGIKRERLVISADMVRDVRGSMVLIGASLSDCIESAPRYIPDEALASRVSAALAAYPPLRAIPGIPLTIDVGAGVVTLSGNVPSGIVRAMAGRLAASVSGVLAVHNELVADEELENRVAEALAKTPSLADARLLLRSRCGVVRIEGRVPKQAKAELGKVREIKGVKDIIDLTVEERR